MIILDTNIVSEFMCRTTNKNVVSWLNHQPKLSLYFTTVSIAEIEFGLRVMPDGKKRHALKNKFERFIELAFLNRILSFSLSAAKCYPEIMANRRELGMPMSMFDGQIAAVAQSKGYTLATRNVKDFIHCDIQVLNPFDET